MDWGETSRSSWRAAWQPRAQPLHGNTIFWFPIRTVQTSEKTNHPPTCLSTTDAICRRRAPSRRQVHCAPPSDRRPDCVRFHARNATSSTRSRLTFREKTAFIPSEYLPRISFRPFPRGRRRSKSTCGVARGSMPLIGPSQPSSEVTLHFCTSLTFFSPLSALNTENTIRHTGAFRQSLTCIRFSRSCLLFRRATFSKIPVDTVTLSLIVITVGCLSFFREMDPSRALLSPFVSFFFLVLGARLERSFTQTPTGLYTVPITLALLLLSRSVKVVNLG